MDKQTQNIVLGVVVIALAAAVAFFIWAQTRSPQRTADQTPPPQTQTPIPPPPAEVQPCTLEAKLCPDGSYVGRTGPNCEFAACPGEETSMNKSFQDTSTWQAATNSEQQVTYLYPEDLEVGEYVTSREWPPEVTVSNEQYSCDEGVSDDLRTGVEERVIDLRTYCIQETVEGVAGSVFSEYVYSTAMLNGTVALAFTLQTVQCANYDQPQRSVCEQEQADFRVDDLAHGIVQTIQPI